MSELISYARRCQTSARNSSITCRRCRHDKVLEPHEGFAPEVI